MNLQPNTSPVKLTIVQPNEQPYVPTLSARERRAYQVAHRIFNENLGQSIVFAADQGSNLVCQGARRSRAVDYIAKVIMEEFR